MRSENLKNILFSLKEEDFFKNVDLHIHSNNSDGEMTPEEIVSSAKKYNMKYISIADHNSLDSYLNTEILNDDIVIPAIEFDCFYKGVLVHILGYGIDVNNEELHTLLAKDSLGKKEDIYRLFHLRNPKEVIEKIKNAGGIAVLAHPACCWVINLDSFIKGLVNYGLDGLEVYYPYKSLRGVVKFHSRKKVFDIAQKYNLIMTGGSDTHSKPYLNFSLTTLSM